MVVRSFRIWPGENFGCDLQCKKKPFQEGSGAVGGTGDFGCNDKDPLIRDSAENGKELVRRKIKIGWIGYCICCVFF